VPELFDAANGLGTPGQNVVAADREGRIGWSIYGAIPRRVGLDGRLPASWADGTRGWSGWLATSEYPRIIDPPSGRIWTANARVVDGEMLALLGDGSYEVGSRATIIRDRLMAQERFSRDDLLRIQLDTSAGFLARWRDLALRALGGPAVDGHEARAIAREILEEGWTGSADPDSAAYRLARVFRDQVTRRVIQFVLADCYEADPAFDYLTVRRREGPVWALVTQQPQHLLDPQFDTWDALLLDAMDDVIAETSNGRPGDLRERVWSEYNVTSYRHPLSQSVPLIGRWLDMPAHTLPGDLYTPRMHWGTAGASERLIASPGHEADGILHMPTGQSGHPLSPFYGSSHEAWVNGDPTPLLPGATVHTLRLVP
jgi:penicillin amidase